MSLLNPINPPAVPFKRPTDDPYNGPGFTALDDTPVVVSLQAASVTNGLAPGQGYTLAGTVFTPRGLDRREGDRFTYQGRDYTLVGPVRGDQDHPFTGGDFGWVAHTIERSS